MSQAKTSSNIKMMTKTAILVALLCISAIISIPIPFTTVLITMQTAMLCIMSLMLPPSWAFAGIIIYILLGIAGLPVFSGGTGGVGRLVGPTGGYIISFIIVVPLISWLKGKKPSFLRYFCSSLISIPIIYSFGSIMYAQFSKIDLWNAFLLTGVPFIIPDILKCLLAAYLTYKLYKPLNS